MRAFAAAALILVIVGCQDRQEDGESESALELTSHDERVIVGTFAYAGSIVTFDSRVVGPDHAILQLEVNGVVLTADADFAGGTFVSDGHQGALYADDLAALLALRDALMTYHPELAGSVHGRLLVRHADRMAEAPIGWTLERHEIDLSEELAPHQGVVTTCGNDGVTCLPGTGGYTYEYHDARSHACQASWTAYGNKSSSCSGRCGMGCNWWFDDDFTQDCLEHDRCTDLHGGSTTSSNPDCGDEFWDADGDYVATYIAYCPN
jgi:hypothetical protein